MKTLAACICLFLTATSLCAQDKPESGSGLVRRIYEDVYWQKQPQQIIFGNSQMRLRINAVNGNWTDFTDTPGKNSIFQNTQTCLDAKVNGAWLLQKTAAKVVSYQVGIDRLRNGVSLEIVRVAGVYEIREWYTLFPDGNRLERRAQLTRKNSALQNSISGNAQTPDKFEGFLFSVPNVQIGDSKDCVFDAPGPFFPNSYTTPGMPCDSLKNREINFHSAPDAGFGILAITNQKLSRTLASWMNTSGEVNYGSSIKGDGKRIGFRHHDFRYAYMPPAFTVSSDIQHCMIAKNLPEALDAYRQMVAQTMPLDSKTPGWVRNAVILEVLPDYFPGGFKGLTKNLARYKEIGFNTVYLMPHWEGGYSPTDLYKVNAKYGTETDLKEMIRTAHGLGMRVLFDMVIHGMDSKTPAPAIRQHPEIFIRKESGGIALHPTWGSASTDWAHPAYRQYMKDLVLHDVRTYGIDGYRVDAASFKGPNWDKEIDYPAYRSGAAAPELMRGMLDALRQVNPEAVLLNEVFGPVFYTVCNFSHDNQAESSTIIQEKMEQKLYRAHDYKQHLTNVYAMLPKGANRVFYARNHDTSWFLHFNGYTPVFMNLETIHAFFGIPEVFAGDRNYPFTPDEKPEVFESYRRIFNMRQQFPELVGGDILLREVGSDNPDVFSGIRRLGADASLVLVSLSGQGQTVKVTLPDSVIPSKPSKWSAKSMTPLSGTAGEGKSIVILERTMVVKLAPYEVWVGRLE